MRGMTITHSLVSRQCGGLIEEEWSPLAPSQMVTCCGLIEEGWPPLTPYSQVLISGGGMVVRGMATPHSVSSVVVKCCGLVEGQRPPLTHSVFSGGDGRHSLTHSVSSVVMWCGLVEGIATHTPSSQW